MAKALNVQTGKVEDVTASTDTMSEEDHLTELRLFRNSRLMASDWTQVADAPLTDAKKKSGRYIVNNCVILQKHRSLLLI